MFHVSFGPSQFPFRFSRGSINVEAKLYLVNTTTEQRLQLCTIADSLLDKSSRNLKGLNIDSLSITNLGNVFDDIIKF